MFSMIWTAKKDLTQRQGLEMHSIKCVGFDSEAVLRLKRLRGLPIHMWLILTMEKATAGWIQGAGTSQISQTFLPVTVRGVKAKTKATRSISYSYASTDESNICGQHDGWVLTADRVLTVAGSRVPPSWPVVAALPSLELPDVKFFLNASSTLDRVLATEPKLE